MGRRGGVQITVTKKAQAGPPARISGSGGVSINKSVQSKGRTPMGKLAAMAEPEFVTDAELVLELKRRDVPPKIGRSAVANWARQPGFPPKLALMGGRRSLPAVLDWIASSYGAVGAPSRDDDDSDLSLEATKRRLRHLTR
jgi:hypothetical protein